VFTGRNFDPAGSGLTEFNLALFQLINSASTPAFDVFFGVISGLGDGLVVAVVCTCVMLWRFRPGLAALTAFAVSGLLTQILKRMVDAPRPPAVLEHVHVLGAVLRTHSFPSGHAASLGVLISLAGCLFGVRDWRFWALSLPVLLAAYGRIYGGVHFPLDVGAGLGIGMVSMWGVWRWLREKPAWAWEQPEQVWRIASLLLMGESAVLGLGYHIQPATAQSLAWIVALASLAYLVHTWRQHGH